METDRLRKSIKIEFEQKFIKQKAQLLETIDKELQSIKEQLAIQIQDENKNIINQNIKLLTLEKKNAQKHDIIVDQEMLLRQQATITQQSFQINVSTQQNSIQQIVDDQQNKSDTQELIIQMEELQARNQKLSLKFSKLLFYLVDLKLYDDEFAKQAALDDFPCDQLYKPKVFQTQQLLSFKVGVDHQIKNKLKKQQVEIDLLKQLNKKLKKQLFFQDLSTDVKSDQQKNNVFTFGEQSQDLKQLEQMLQPLKNTQQKCKTLNDIILKKRKQSYDSGEPTFDFYQLNRKLIADRLLQKPIQFLDFQRCRVHSQQIKK